MPLYINNKPRFVNKNKIISNNSELVLKSQDNIEIYSEFYPEYKTVYDAFTTKPDDDTVLAQETMVKSLDENGVWDKLDALWVFAGHTNDDGESQINWKNPGTYDATLSNSPSFSAFSGFLTNGTTSYIRTNWIPSDGVNYSLYSASAFVYSTWSETSPGFDLGATSGYGLQIAPDLGTDDRWATSIHGNVWREYHYSNYGFYHISRTSSSSISFYRNGSLLQTNNSNSAVAEPSVQVYIGCQNNNNSPSLFSEKRYACAGVGGAMNSTEVSNLYSAILTYMNAT